MFERTLELYNGHSWNIHPSDCRANFKRKKAALQSDSFLKNLLSYRRKPFLCFCNQKTGVAQHLVSQTIMDEKGRSILLISKFPIMTISVTTTKHSQTFATSSIANYKTCRAEYSDYKRVTSCKHIFIGSFFFSIKETGLTGCLVLCTSSYNNSNCWGMKFHTGSDTLWYETISRPAVTKTGLVSLPVCLGMSYQPRSQAFNHS